MECNIVALIAVDPTNHFNICKAEHVVYGTYTYIALFMVYIAFIVLLAVEP